MSHTYIDQTKIQKELEEKYSVENYSGLSIINHEIFLGILFCVSLTFQENEWLYEQSFFKVIFHLKCTLFNE